MADTKLTRLQRTIPSIYNPQTNRIVKGLLQAWGEGDENAVTQIAETKKQIFVKTAEGRFLDSLASNVGVDRPLLIALADIFFRDLIVQLSFAPKQIRKTMYDVLDVFWGPTFSRANVTSVIAEPFDLGSFIGLNGQITFQQGSNLVNGYSSFFLSEVDVGDFIKFNSDDNSKFGKVIAVLDDTHIVLSEVYGGSSVIGLAKKYVPKTLQLSIDGKEAIDVAISPTHFIDTTAVTSDELSSALTSDIVGSSGSIVKVINSFNQFINIRTNTPGSTGSINIIDGTLNDVVLFPTGINTIDDLVKSTIIYEINPREIVLKVPNLVAKLTRTLRGAIHLHDNIRGTLLSVNDADKEITALLTQSVFEDQLADDIYTEDLEELGIIGNTKAFSQSNGVLFQFPVASVSWVVNHNLGVQLPQVAVYDLNDLEIIPNSVTGVNANRLTINFSAPQAGRVYVVSDVSKFDFLTPDIAWTVNHALGTKYVNVQLYDNNNKLIQPNQLTLVDENSLTVDFALAQAGRAVVSANFIHEQSVSATTWTINHNLGLKNVNVTVYDDNDELIIPNSIDASAQNTAVLSFGAAVAGHAVVGDTPDNVVTIFFGPGEDLTNLSANSLTLGSPVVPSTSWNLAHNANHQYLNFNVYNLLNKLIIPDHFTAVDNNNALASFGNALQGRVYLTANNDVFHFPVASTTWTVNHNLGTQYLNVSTYNSSSQAVIPHKITAIDANTLELEFLTPASGHVALSIDTIHTQGVAAATWNVEHNIGSKFVIVTVYSAADEVVVPDTVFLNDVNNLTITFGSAVSGHAVVGDTTSGAFMIINPKYPNSFIYDTQNQFSISKVRTKLAQSISVGDVVVSLSVEDSSHIPDQEGYLIFNFGRSNQEQPIHYLARPNNSTLLLDPTHVFASNHEVGDVINVLADTKAFVPRSKGQDYPVFITGTREALEMVQSIIAKLKAVGVVLRWIVDNPTYRFGACGCSDCNDQG